MPVRLAATTRVGFLLLHVGGLDRDSIAVRVPFTTGNTPSYRIVLEEPFCSSEIAIPGRRICFLPAAYARGVAWSLKAAAAAAALKDDFSCWQHSDCANKVLCM